MSSVGKKSGSVLMFHDVGLHARPSVSVTKLAKSFASDISLGLSADGPWVNAKSIVKVMALKAPKDTVLYFKAEGDDAETAVSALIELVEKDFASDGS